MGRSVGTSPHSADDRALLARVRRGDRSAFAELYERHVEAARRYARTRLSNPTDADDIVADVFASVLSSIEGGKGPADEFVPYLISSVRRQCARVNRHAQRERADDVEADHRRNTRTAASEPDALAGVDDADVVREAYETLPARFRDVLWRTEVAGRSHEEIAREVGSTPRAIAVLASRARQALATAYLERHLTTAPAAVASRTCRNVRADLAMVVRGSAGRRRLRRVEDHLAECAMCRDAHDSLTRMNDKLRALPFLPIGVVGAASVKGESGAKATLLGWISTPAAKVVAGSVVVVSVVTPIAVHQRWLAAAPSPPAAGQLDGAASTGAPVDSADARTAEGAPTIDATLARTPANLVDLVLSKLVGGIESTLQAPLPNEHPVSQVVPRVPATVPTSVPRVLASVPTSAPVGADGVAVPISVPATVPTSELGNPTPSVAVVRSVIPGNW